MTKKKRDSQGKIDPVAILKRDLKSTGLWITLCAALVAVLSLFQRYIF